MVGTEDIRTWLEFLFSGVIALGVIFNGVTSLLTHSNMKKLEVNTNSKMDALLAARTGEANLQGQKDGQAAERRRQEAKDSP